MVRCAFTTVHGHDTYLRVCGWVGGGGSGVCVCVGGCLASVSGPMYMFVLSFA